MIMVVCVVQTELLDVGKNKKKIILCKILDILPLASLRTSRTWTDGADNGKENIPFVRPHPPSGPSSDRARRKPRVKSAGKERTPHTGFTGKEFNIFHSLSCRWI